ncbi:hypothetical protein AN958_06261 [Leucoagaricus sp. SymC.cos]|nr:hypothetical protein AN958_06261 [Leucoagaricus sp. SymC.cos]
MHTQLIGTSLTIGIPILMFRKARATAFQMSLDNPSSAPPRRIVHQLPSRSKAISKSPSSTRRFRPLPSSTTASPTSEQQPSSSEWDSNPSLLFALSKASTSNALLAGKALLIATTLVGIGAFGVFSLVQYAIGAYTVQEFARLIPENEEERKATLEVAPFGAGGEEEEWKWEAAKKRMKKAYEQGGFTLWEQVALRELEAEARVERGRRQREVAVEAASRSQRTPS